MTDLPWSLFSPFSQTIGRFVNNPVTDWRRFFSPQVIFNYNPEDEPVEAHVLSKVGSYGSQLSTLIDVLAVLTKNLDPDTLPEPEKKALQEFATLRANAQKAVDEARGLVTPREIADAVKAMARRRPELLPELERELATALERTAPKS